MQDQAIRMLGSFLEDVQLATHAGFQRHDDAFAQTVDGRIGDLCKHLAEIVVQRSYLPRQHGDRRIVAHRTGAFGGLFSQWTHYLVSFFKRYLEHFHVHFALFHRERFECRQVFGQG